MVLLARQSRGTCAVGCVLLLLALSAGPANAQSSDGLLNGTIAGAAVGAGLGIAFSHAVRDSDLGFNQYAYGALVFGAIGAGIGLGVDALLNRRSPAPGVFARKVTIAPAVGRKVAGVAVRWRW